MQHPTLPNTQAPVMSLEEWADMPEDDEGEIVDGRLVEEEVPDYTHEVVVIWLGSALRGWVVPHGGVVGGSEAKFAVRPTRGRKPDLTVYFGESRKPPKRGLVRVPPDVAVEVVSTRPKDRRRDRIDKMDEYASFGVRFYWIVEPEIRSLEIFALTEGQKYARVLAATEGRVDAVPGCSGLVLDLDTLWAEVDRLSDDEAAED